MKELARLRASDRIKELEGRVRVLERLEQGLRYEAESYRKEMSELQATLRRIASMSYGDEMVAIARAALEGKK